MKIRKYLIAIFCLIVFSFAFTNIKANDLSLSNENTFQNISNDLDNEGKSVNVSTWDEFNDAMTSDDINNINIKSNLVYTATNQAEKNVRIPLKSIKINGEGHKIDFRGISFFNNDTVQQNMNIKWNINNLDMYGRNYFGPLKSGGYTNNNNPNYGSGVITYDNVSYYGAQLCSVYNFDAIFNGKNTVNSVNSYISPFDNKKYSTQTNQNAIEATNLTVTDNATLNSTVDNAGVIYLDNQGSFKIGNNSYVNLQSLKAGGENNQSALWVKDSLTIGDDSNLSIETAPDGYQSICNMPDTSYKRDFKIGDRSKFYAKVDGQLNPSSNWWPKSTLDFGNNIQFNQGKDSNFKVEALNAGKSRDMDLLDFGSSSSFNQDENSTFDLNVAGVSENKNNLINFGDGTSFNQSKYSKFNINVNKSSGNQADLINFSKNNNINLDSNASFKINAESLSGNTSDIIYVGNNSNFKLGSSTNFEINLPNSSGNNTNVMNFDTNSYLDLGSDTNFKIDTEASGSTFDVLRFKSDVKLNFDKVKNFEINMKKNKGDMFVFGTSNNEMNINQQDVEFRKTNDSELHGFYGINSAYIPINYYAKTQNDIDVNTKDKSNLTKNSFLNNFDVSDFKYLKVSGETSRENNPVHKINKWDELEDAMLDSYITNISIEDDLVNDKDKSSHRDTQIPLRSIDFNGNNHKIDFRGKSYYNNSSVFKNSNIEWNIDNVDMYGQNYYGPFKAAGSTKTNNGTGTITYNNISYLGAQLTASYTYDLNFKNKIKNSSVNSYTSPFDNKIYNGDKNQVNIEATNINVLDNSEYIGTTENAGVIFLNNNGQLNIGNNSVMDLTSGGTNGEYSNYVLRMKGNLDTGRNSKLNINPRESSSQTAISLDSGTEKNNSFYLHKGSEVNIDDDTNNKDNSNLDLVSIASKTNILIDDEAKLNIKTSRNSILNSSIKRKIFDVASNGILEIGDKGALKIQAGGGKNLDLMNFSSSSQFLMNNTRSVDIDARKNTHKNTNLISMASGGVLESTEQAVSAWNRGKSADDDEPSYSWDPIKNMKVFFNNAKVNDKKTEADGLNTGYVQNFKDNFKTENFSRVLFTYIPDVTATIDNDLSPIKPDINSHQIKGTATPGAYVRFAGDPAFPEPNIHYEGSDTEPEYHTIADKNGNYSFDLPKDKYFTAGNTITAEASLGGKTYTASKKVKNMPNGDFSSYVTNSYGDKTDSIYRSNSSKLNYTYDNTSGYNITNPKITIELPDNFNFKTNEIESYIDGKFINNDNVKLSKDGNKLVISYSKTNLEENQKLEFTIPFNTDNENKNISIHAKASGTVNPDYYVDNIGENDLTINLLESALELKSVPDLNYGNVNDLSVGKPIKTINSQIVGIKDTYPYVNNWRLELLPTDFYDNEGNKVDFDLRYNEKKLDTTYYNVLYENKKINNGNLDLDLHKGIDLVPASNNNVSRSKEYKADLNWSITDAP